ncbi:MULTISPECIES: hypothetical protein [Methylobacterium]|uniref:Sulfur globule protein n=1 Tax=Methylobacterium thuringiense TaxID=1003091 RepID=A0ABQ4TPA4_9HYPH|nr:MULTISPECIES: hypothetical protein [Methylobacterium]TXN21668.1 hypothetical protein FV217_13580 [Methylobacterium sp. WL9]GJE55673.1 hypothetical protein EKPJFOCH_2168 [Methylobacterium thuringiense]
MARMTMAAAGAALVLMAGTGAALAFGGGGGSSGEGDGHLRQEMQNPGYVEPSRYAYRDGYRRKDPGAEYEAYRRGYPIFGPWGSKYRY